MHRPGFVYIITNTHHTTLYVGATDDLPARIIEHRDKIDPKSFSARYNLHKLVYYEAFDRVHDAFIREYQIKSWSRIRKEVLISSMNPEWKDLFDEIADYLKHLPWPGGLPRRPLGRLAKTFQYHSLLNVSTGFAAAALNDR